MFFPGSTFLASERSFFLVAGFRFPLPKGVISSGFGMRTDPFNRHVIRFHPGIDIAAPLGTPIFAARGGRVISAEWSDAYGNYVLVLHDNGWESLYGHMSKILVSHGQIVETGEVLGRVGSTGISTGPHLHFEIRRHGVAENPLDLLARRTRHSNFVEKGAAHGFRFLRPSDAERSLVSRSVFPRPGAPPGRTRRKRRGFRTRAEFITAVFVERNRKIRNLDFKALNPATIAEDYLLPRKDLYNFALCNWVWHIFLPSLKPKLVENMLLFGLGRIFSSYNDTGVQHSTDADLNIVVRNALTAPERRRIGRGLQD